MKLCLTCNPGGHYVALQRLAETWKGFDVFYVVSRNPVTQSLLPSNRVYRCRASDRRRPLAVLMNVLTAFRVIRKERPDVVLTTGASIAAPVCLAAWLHGIPIIWVDSVANSVRVTLSGRLVRRMCARFYTQWTGIAARHTGIRYRGRV